MKRIPLTQGKYALVDDEDYEQIGNLKWYYQKKSHSKVGYARRGAIYMHREIAKPAKGQLADHINGNTLDNRRSNLRVCTKAENTYNRRMSRLNKSGFKGVSWEPVRKRWVAAIKVEGKSKSLGRFKDKIGAAKAYNAAALKYHGEFAKLNVV